MNGRDEYRGRRRPPGGALPDELAEQLPAGLRLALNHPVRRNILRALHNQRVACTVRELIGMPGLAEESGSALSYHAKGLVRCNAATVYGELLIYRSLVASDAVTLSILEQTRAAD